MGSASGEGNVNEGSNAARSAKGKLLRRVLLKIGIGLLAHESIEELDDLIDEVSQAARDAIEDAGGDIES
ncbi:hypothetical protein ACFV2H_48805 [Streptomyces sp. NPDC059629]|uniref:hypothetical protein n=1 Tax=Streptomyces sp. NPDC059629 TaxID=3346889 RepID=UPI00369B2183